MKKGWWLLGILSVLVIGLVLGSNMAVDYSPYERRQDYFDDRSLNDGRRDVKTPTGPTCGDGVCNTEETILSCFNDCQFVEILEINQDVSEGENFGKSVDIDNGDFVIGSFEIVDSDPFTPDLGSVDFYHINDNLETFLNEYIPSEDLSQNQFGYPVSISDEFVVVGAQKTTENGITSAGSVYIFEKQESNGEYVFKQKLISENPFPGGLYGSSLAIQGNNLFVGASNEGFPATGAVYYYRYQNDQWNFIEKLNPNPGDFTFGRSLDVDGNWLIVGSSGTASPLFAGSIYFYEFDGSNWNYFERKTASDMNGFDNLGFSVTIQGNKALAGAIKDIDFGLQTGSVYAFSFDGENWNEDQEFSGSNLNGQDTFGYFVNLKDDLLFVASPTTDEVALDSGAIYVFYYDENKPINERWTEAQILTGSLLSQNSEMGGSFSTTTVRPEQSIGYSGNYLIVGTGSENRVYLFKQNRE